MQQSSCHHDYKPLSARPFQVLAGAAWLPSWCPLCGDTIFSVRNPMRNEPVADQLQ
jgi:hypothetical protein